MLVDIDAHKSQSSPCTKKDNLKLKVFLFSVLIRDNDKSILNYTCITMNIIMNHNNIHVHVVI